MKLDEFTIGQVFKTKSLKVSKDFRVNLTLSICM
ncbi:hypothetical protein C7M27_03226 [Bacillus subtilis]|nr:hypothetical protein C7M27_03226 [Bacillus subtilis]